MKKYFFFREKTYFCITIWIRKVINPIIVKRNEVVMLLMAVFPFYNNFGYFRHTLILFYVYIVFLLNK